MDVSTGTEGVTQGNISDGVYVKFKPAQVIPLAIGATLLLGAVITFGPEILAGLGALGEASSNLTPALQK